MTKVGHGNAHSMLKEGAGIVEVTVQVFTLQAKARHVLLEGSVFLHQPLVLGLKHQNVFALSLTELLSGFAVAKDFVVGFMTSF